MVTAVLKTTGKRDIPLMVKKFLPPLPQKVLKGGEKPNIWGVPKWWQVFLDESTVVS